VFITVWIHQKQKDNSHKKQYIGAMTPRRSQLEAQVEDTIVSFRNSPRFRTSNSPVVKYQAKTSAAMAKLLRS